MFEGFDPKNKKGKSHSEYDLNKLLPFGIAKIHKIIGDSLDVSIDDKEKKNSKLKEIIKNLEYTLMMPPILASALAIVQPETLDLKLKGTSSLLVVVRKIVEENIKKRMYLIMQAWDVGIGVDPLPSKGMLDFLVLDHLKY